MNKNIFPIFLTVIMALGVFSAYGGRALAADTGWNTPSVSVGGGQFTDPDNAFIPDDLYASENTNNQKQQYGGFNIPSVPAGSVINGIEVRIEAHSSHNSNTRNFDVDLSWNNGLNFGNNKNTDNYEIDDGIQTLGSPTNTWGRTWSPDEFTNNNFKIRIEANLSSSRILYLDHLEVKVYYTSSPASVPFAETFGNSNSGTVSGWIEKNPAEILGSASGADITRDGTASDKFVKIGENSGGHGYICRAFDPAGASNLFLSYFWNGDLDAEENDYGIVEYKTTGSCSDTAGWTNVISHSLKQSVDNNWQSQSPVVLPVNNNVFLLKFRNDANSSNNNEHFRIDDIFIQTDTEPPVLSLPPDITAEAASPEGAIVDYTVTATDNLDPSPAISCAPASGSAFALGINPVSCTATDIGGNISSGEFNITVEDTTPPDIALNGSDPMTIQVHNAYEEPGAVVTDNYDTEIIAIITDGVDIETVGSYMVYYDAIDSSGNLAIQKMRTVNVVDNESPSTNDDIPADWQNSEIATAFNCTDNVSCVKVYYTTDGTDPNAETSAYVDASSAWQFAVSGDGQYVIKYFGIDESNNQEAVKTATNLLKIDTSVPSVPVLTSPENNSETVSDPMLSWEESSDTVSGIKDYLIELFNVPPVPEGEPYFSDYAMDTEYDLSETEAGGFSDGIYYWRVNARDNAGNESEWSDLWQFVKDTVNPLVSLTSPLNDSYHNEPTINIAGSATDNPVMTIKYIHLYYQKQEDEDYTQIDADSETEEIQSLENTESSEPFDFIFNWTPPENGSYNIRAIAEDKAENYSEPATINGAIYDTLAPSVPVAEPAGGDYQNDIMVSLSSEEINLDAIYYTLNGDTPTAESEKYDSGEKINITASATLKAIAYDKAGNISGIMEKIYGIAPVISEEILADTQVSSFTATWTTDDPATSRVIYDTVSRLELGEAPNYGYANSTIEDGTKVTNHAVTVSGLSDGTIYYYRTVSHGSPESVSSEKSVTTSTPPPASDEGSGNGGSGSGGGGSPILGTYTGAALGAPLVPSQETPTPSGIATALVIAPAVSVNNIPASEISSSGAASDETQTPRNTNGNETIASSETETQENLSGNAEGFAAVQAQPQTSPASENQPEQTSLMAAIVTLGTGNYWLTIIFSILVFGIGYGAYYFIRKNA